MLKIYIVLDLSLFYMGGGDQSKTDHSRTQAQESHQRAFPVFFEKCVDQVLFLQIQLLRNAICSASPPKKCQRIGWKFCTLATFRRNWAEIEFAAGAAPSQKNLKTRWKGQEDGNEWKGSIEQQDRSEIPRLFILKNSKIFKNLNLAPFFTIRIQSFCRL